MCICFVDDVIFWVPNESDIIELANQQESDVTGFLVDRIELNPTTGLMELKQTGLIDRVIEMLVLDILTTSGKFTPVEATRLVKDNDGDPALGDISYSIVVMMLLYLAGHT
ncbi:hypothetical protein ACHAW6_012332 [Cyclotella cf. meneghiniana]